MYFITTNLDNRNFSEGITTGRLKTGSNYLYFLRLHIYNLLKDSCENRFTQNYPFVYNKNKKSDCYIRINMLFTNYKIRTINTYNRLNLCLEKKNIILSDRYNFYDINILVKFNIKISENYIVYFYEYNNNANCLKLCKYVIAKLSNSYDNILYKNIISTIVKYSTLYCYIDILEYVKTSGISLDVFTCESITHASSLGHTIVLDWLFNSGFELKYDEKALDIASERGHINVLEWWKNSGLPLKYSKNALDKASWNNNLDVLEWWANSGLNLIYSEHGFNNALLHTSVKALDWWTNSGLELRYSPHVFTNVIKNFSYNSSFIEWLLRNKSKFNFLETNPSIQYIIDGLLFNWLNK
uniref:Ankyrin repeat protein n=1 Tax=viral metagenome TaxID=1070528 RepID=A0A6C0E8B9_9ZZZZ